MKKFLIIAILGLLFCNKIVAQFTTKTNLSNLAISANTREKPQSKVWIHDNKHWCLLSNSSGAHIWRLDNTTWTRILTVSSSSNLRADCKVDGNLVHILLFRANSTELASVEYVSSNATYKRWTNRSSNVSIGTDSNAETATIDIDSNGRMWMVYDTDNSILARWSDSPYSTWSSPITIASNINSDDIGAVIAIPAFNKIGVFWNNQNTERWGFKLHTDGASPTTWSSDENPAAQYALNQGNGFSDDHMNLKTGSDGTLYCTVKTGYDTQGYTKITLLVRRPNGTWDPPYKVSEMGTRGIGIVNEVAQKIRVIYTETEDGGDIYYRESALSPISFGQQFTLFSGSYNNPTSVKNNYTGQVVILASTSSVAVGALVSDGTTPPPLPGTPTLASPADNATGVSINPTLSWNAASNASSYEFQVSTTNTFTSIAASGSNITALSTTVSNLNYSTQYYWRVRATNVSGTGSWSTFRTFTTQAQTVTPPGTPTLNSPANSATGVAINPTLSWNAASNATSYQLQVATANTFTTATLVHDISNITTLTQQVSGLNNSTQYFWRVRAYNGTVEGSWSTIRNFTTVAAPVTPPDVPTLASPADNATGVSINPALSWNAASNAATYEFQVATDNAFASVVASGSNITTLSTNVSGLNYNTQYFWHVRASNSAGTSNWSATRAFTTVTQPVTPAAGLVAHWQMESVSSNTLTDATANTNNATTVGSPVLVTGKIGQALRLNGSNQYATAPNNTSLNINNAITIAAWIKPERTGSRQIILKKGNSVDGYEFSLTGSAKVCYRFNQESGGSDFELNSSGTHPTNGTTWMHIAATFDGTTMKVYLNGILDKSKTVSPAEQIASNTQSLGIGATNSGSSRYQGAIDDLRIYNVALSAADISSLANNTSPRMAAESAPAPTGNSVISTANRNTSPSTVYFIVPAKGDYTITLYDLSGKPVRILKQGYANSKERLTVDLNEYNVPDGIYMVKLLASKSSQTYLRVKVEKQTATEEIPAQP